MKNLLLVWFVVFTSLILSLTGCGTKETHQRQATKCVPAGDFSDVIISESRVGIHKEGKFGECLAETTPVVFKGLLVAVTYHQGYVLVYDFKSQKLISKAYGAGQFGSAIVVNDKLYYFSSHSPDIKIMATQDLYNWTTPQTVFTIDTPSTQVWNTSVTEDAQGFVMAYEVTEPDLDGYSWRMAKSTDLIHWTKIGERFDNKYSACPTVRYIAGQYYFTYLAYERGSFITKLARSNDFINYETARGAFLAPSTGEGRNTSDVDFVEYNGQVYLVYLDGNQNGWDDQMWATFDGTMEEMLEGMF